MHDDPISKGSLALDSLRERVYTALRAWNKTRDISADLLDDLLLYQEIKAIDVAVDSVPRQTTNRLLAQMIDHLQQQNTDYAELLRERFYKGRTLAGTSSQMGWTIDQVRHHQRQAIEQLAALIAGEEQQLRSEKINIIESRLPPASYSQLFGFTEKHDELVAQLLADDRSWVAAVTGIGGIGKTALADAVTRSLARRFRFRAIVWLRVDSQAFEEPVADYRHATDVLANELAREIAPEVAGNVPMQARLMRVRQVLKSEPHLIVIDNLETISDTAYLLRQLQDWAQPSKFLLTTRARPVGELSIFSTSVAELAERDAADLLRHHAMQIGQPDLAQATDEQFGLIYKAVGGNPLAIKLVVSLAKTMPLPIILDDLTNAYSYEIEALYARIYQRSWLMLTESQRELLRVMPLVAESGATVNQLKKLSGLTDAELYPAINELVNRSLLELRGTAWDRRYGIHRITATFLQTDINRWNSDEGQHEELNL